MRRVHSKNMKNDAMLAFNIVGGRSPDKSASFARNVCSSTLGLTAASVAVGIISVSFPFPLDAQEEFIIQGRPRVVDGDTFVFDGLSGEKKRVRLLAVDAFEISQSCQNAAGEPYACGRIARQSMIDIIGGESVVCNGIGNDVFGRLIGTCSTVDTKKDVGEELVRKGGALAFRRYGKQYVAAENDARERRMGAWAGMFTEPWTFRKVTRQAGHFNVR
jgi:endonuclease YncB( thermonuclease family)